MNAPIDSKTWTETHLVRIAQSMFRLEGSDGTVVTIDPFRASPLLTPADVVLITHNHGDHFNARVVKTLLKQGTRVVVPASVKASGGDKGLATDTLSPGETKTIGPLTITAVRAYNLAFPAHPKAKNWLGYLFTLDGLRIYHAGDTDLIPEMYGLKADIALLPAGGMATMNAAAAAQAAGLLGAKVAVPMHYALISFSGGAGKKFAQLWSGTTVLA